MFNCHLCGAPWATHGSACAPKSVRPLLAATTTPSVHANDVTALALFASVLTMARLDTLMDVVERLRACNRTSRSPQDALERFSDELRTLVHDLKDKLAAAPAAPPHG